MGKPVAQHGDLRVWHIPQVPGKPFYVAVASVVEARIVLDALAEYDRFQFENRIKLDYANASGLSVFDANDGHDMPSGSWVDWYSKNGEGIDNYTLADLRATPQEWEGL